MPAYGTTKPKSIIERERAAFAAGARKAEQESDVRSMERIAIALEKIVRMMEGDRRTGQ